VAYQTGANLHIKSARDREKEEENIFLTIGAKLKLLIQS
jgi:hypothetical protein